MITWTGHVTPGHKLAKYFKGHVVPLASAIAQIFKYSELSGGMSGYYHEATAGRSTMYADRGFWHGKITGTDAVIYGRDYSGMLNVSVDGGPWVDATNESGLHTLFSGLADETHDVTIRADAIFGSSNCWLDTAQEYSISVLGTSPSIYVLSHSAMPFDQSKALWSGENTAQSDINYPSSLIPQIGSAQKSSMVRVQFETAATELVIAVNTSVDADPSIWISIDGAEPTITATTNGVARITGLSGTHTYNIWASSHDSGSAGRTHIYGINANAAITPPTNPKRLDQFGDSISEGVLAAPQGYVETNEVAAYFGYLGCNYSVAGNTINGLLTKLTDGSYNTDISNIIGVNDVAVLAIGRNNVSSGIDVSEQADYESIIDSLVALGYSKILCRGILPESGNNYATENAILESIVTGYGNSNVIWIDTSGWTSIDSQDGTHPSITGYSQMVNYAKVSYAGYL